jgi:hypothetical protein
MYGRVHSKWHSGLPLNSVLGTNEGRKWRGVKGRKRFSVHFKFNGHTYIQVVFLNNFENYRSPFKNETLHQDQVKAVVGAHMKE